jgi:hypothetical protein
VYNRRRGDSQTALGALSFRRWKCSWSIYVGSIPPVHTGCRPFPGAVGATRKLYPYESRARREAVGRP